MMTTKKLLNSFYSLDTLLCKIDSAFTLKACGCVVQDSESLRTIKTLKFIVVELIDQLEKDYASGLLNNKECLEKHQLFFRMYVRFLANELKNKDFRCPSKAQSLLDFILLLADNTK